MFVVRPSPVVIFFFSHLQLLRYRWTDLNDTWQEGMKCTSSTKFLFFGSIRQQRWPPWPQIPLYPLSGIWRNLTGSKLSTSLIKFVFFEPIRQQRWPIYSLPLVDWRKLTYLDRKQVCSAHYRVCVFLGRSVYKDDLTASDWLRHFRLLHLQPLNKIWRTWSGSMYSSLSTHFEIFGTIRQQILPFCLLICWDIFDFFSATAEWNFKTYLQRPRPSLFVLFCFCRFIVVIFLSIGTQNRIKNFDKRIQCSFLSKCRMKGQCIPYLWDLELEHKRSSHSKFGNNVVSKFLCTHCYSSVWTWSQKVSKQIECTVKTFVRAL